MEPGVRLVKERTIWAAVVEKESVKVENWTRSSADSMGPEEPSSPGAVQARVMVVSEDAVTAKSVTSAGGAPSIKTEEMVWTPPLPALSWA